MYDMIPRGLSGMPGMVAGAKALPEGRPIAILEPYYKVMADGSLGVRVDNPLEVGARWEVRQPTNSSR